MDQLLQKLIMWFVFLMTFYSEGSLSHGAWGCRQNGMGVCQRETRHIPVLWEGERPCWGAGGIHTPKGKEVSEHVFNFQGVFKKSLSNPGLNSARSGGNEFYASEGLHHRSIPDSMCGWTGLRRTNDLG